LNEQSNEAAFLKAAAAVLEDYLLSDVLFWPLQREDGAALKGDTDQLTPGNLLLNLARFGQKGEAEPALADALHKIESIRSRWRTAWRNKCQKEWEQRIKLWLGYLEELQRERAEALPADFAFNVRQRVILDLLNAEMDPLPEDKRLMLQSADRLLRSLSQPGDFVWQKDLQNRLPASSFWYLYLKTKRKNA